MLDPLAGGATEIEVAIYAVDLTGGVGTRGALLASATAAISDVGLGFYDVPISFSFAAGTRYDVAFNAVAPTSDWGFGLNNLEV